MLSQGCNDQILDLCRSDATDRACCCFPPTQQRRADIESIAHAILARKARTHAVALVVIELAGQERAAFGSLYLPAIGFGFEELLNSLERRGIDDGLMFALEPLAVVVNLADIRAVFEEVSEGNIGEGNAAVVFGDFGISSLGDDAPAVE